MSFLLLLSRCSGGVGRNAHKKERQLITASLTSLLSQISNHVISLCPPLPCQPMCGFKMPAPQKNIKHQTCTDQRRRHHHRRHLHPSPCNRRPYPPLPYKLSPPAALSNPTPIKLHRHRRRPLWHLSSHYLHLIRRHYNDIPYKHVITVIQTDRDPAGGQRRCTPEFIPYNLTLEASKATCRAYSPGRG